MAGLLFKDLDVYKIAHQIGFEVWELVNSWSYFNKDTLGKQLIRSADSISLNLCEGYGRFYYKEKKVFYYYARGSLYETFECLKKASERNLIEENQFNKLASDITLYGPKLNNFINSVGKSKQSTKVVSEK